LVHYRQITALACLGLVLACTSCATVRVAQDIKFLSFRDDYQTPAVENLGPVRGRTCAHRYGLFGPRPTVSKAVDQLRAAYPDLRFLQNARLQMVFKNYVFWQQECWEIVGYGFR